MRTFVVFFAVAAVLSACSDSVGVSEQAELARHEAQWQQRTFHSYDFDLAKQVLGSNVNLHVSVRADSVAGVIDNDTGQPPVFDAGAMTVDEVFADANSTITSKQVKVGLQFDEQYGYPTLYTVRSIANTPGGPFSATLSNLTPVQ
ncbi:MAG TPA: DUF6174 domain-containing protein [Gemmatimonadaceae bacterium]|jgi:hypothetical protein|nr:DUF6174 domain-containing protein [Gemmatimonadaceae bacterium]